MQAAYELEATYAQGGPVGTGRIESSESVLVPWPFDPLRSREVVRIRVRAWDADQRPTEWSTHEIVEAGLLERGDWVARWIAPRWEEDPARPQPCPFLRRVFDVRGPVARARLYATARGVYELTLDGSPLDDDVLSPGWTSYPHRMIYRARDLSNIEPGPHILGAVLGDGWYRGRLGPDGGRRNIYGDRLSLLAQLEIEYEDGTTDVISTDDGWLAARGPILASDLYDGETYDARLEDAGGWSAVDVVEGEDAVELVAAPCPPMRRTELLGPREILTSPSGKTILDFGQNLVGRLRLAVTGERGRTITLRHAEVLEDGELCTRPLRTALATDRYTLRGGSRETWEPRFTYHGFRYAEIEGWPGAPTAEDIRAVVCHSDLERTGWFDCSDPLVNRLHENVVWSMRGNFLHVPTDCPQRDERLGWTGDIQVFAPTACFLYDVSGLLRSWLRDLAAEQAPSGLVPVVVPNVLDDVAAAGWGDAAVIVPWVLYQRFGDTGVLDAQFESMRAWVDHVTELAGPDRLWNDGFQFGDWLDPSAPPDNPARGLTDPSLVATAYFARSSELLADAAAVLRRADDEQRYRDLAEEVRAAFVAAYGEEASATACSLALEFSLLPDRAEAGRRLVRIVQDNGYRVSTGFLGTPLLCDALCSVGEHETAYRLLMERSCPSWLFPVTMGATTIWERWDSMRPDGSINTSGMTSFNHYAFGAVADWLHRTVAGLAPGAPGYRRLTIAPKPGGGLTHASAAHRTPYGLASAAWKIADGTIEVTASIPANTTATVVLPFSDRPPFVVGSGDHRWAYAPTVV
jgi:alpha-L-rhamnosidase